MSPVSQTAVPTSNGELVPGHVLGRYELLLPIASGGMAAVWAARMRGTRGFQKIVAVKTMLPKLSDDAQFEQMFLDEASLASQVRHPHVVEIMDLGEQYGVLYLVMEWIDGVPLHELMKAGKRQGGLPLPVAVRIALQACAGLHAAHELRNPQGDLVGLVHRDISPQNILVTYTGVTKVVDFGVAKATALNDGATGHGQLKGKVSYMAPEQVLGEPMDRRADIFAMGIVLYALTTGKHPFRGESEAATLFNISSSKPAMGPRRVVPGYPEELESIVIRALSKDPAKRFATANDMARALDQSLPAKVRASTDEDVAAFVRELLGEQREQQRMALANALEKLDRDGGQPLPSQTSILHTPLSVVAGPEPSVTGSFGRELSADSLSASGAELFAASRRRRLWIGAAVLGALGVAGAGTVWAIWSGEASDRVRATAAPASNPAAEKEQEPALEPVDPDSLPIDETPIPAIDHDGSERTDTAPQPLTDPPAAGPQPTRRVEKDWKQDPGF